MKFQSKLYKKMRWKWFWRGFFSIFALRPPSAEKQLAEIRAVAEEEMKIQAASHLD